jgi:hypothetical protein
MERSSMGRGRGRSPHSLSLEHKISHILGNTSDLSENINQVHATAKPEVFEDQLDTIDSEEDINIVDKKSEHISESSSESKAVPSVISDDSLFELEACLVCIDAIVSKDPTWQCVECFCVYHLYCIQVSTSSWRLMFHNSCRDGAGMRWLLLQPHCQVT